MKIDEMAEYFKLTTDYTRYSIPKTLVPGIKNIVFNPPATVVLWDDGSKTVVKCGEHDLFDPEKGIAMAISKKALGNEGNYYNNIKKWIEKYENPNKNFNVNEPEYQNNYNPILKAYDMIKDFHHGGKTTDFDEVLGYLGEALDS